MNDCAIPFAAIGPDELGEPTETIRCTRCGNDHKMEYGTSQTMRADGTWSEPVPSRLIGFYHCVDGLFVGTINGKKWGRKWK